MRRIVMTLASRMGANVDARKCKRSKPQGETAEWKHFHLTGRLSSHLPRLFLPFRFAVFVVRRWSIEIDGHQRPPAVVRDPNGNLLALRNGCPYALAGPSASRRRKQPRPRH